MNILELSFRNESVFMTKGDIIGISNDEWFLKNILEVDYFPEEENNKLEINEDKNTAMSLIESMRYNRLIVYPRVSMDYLLLLGEKWCIPENILEMIKERMNHNINVNNLDYAIHENPVSNEIDNMVFKCYCCGVGFKMKENKRDSCVTHGIFHPGIETFICCGGKHGAGPCRTGYHVLSDCDNTKYLNQKNSK